MEKQFRLVVLCGYNRRAYTPKGKVVFPHHMSNEIIRISAGRSSNKRTSASKRSN